MNAVLESDATQCTNTSLSHALKSLTRQNYSLRVTMAMAESQAHGQSLFTDRNSNTSYSTQSDAPNKHSQRVLKTLIYPETNSSITVDDLWTL